MAKDNVDLICSIGELAGLFDKTEGLREFLQKVVSIVAYHMKAAVCSIYLYDEETRELTLSANQGLNSSHIGRANLRLGEGITGTALKELRPIREGNASANPNFKLIKGLDDERYKAFLAVPIVRGLARVGVIVLQDAVPDYFTENDEKALRAIAAQLASTIENAKILIALHTEKPAQASTPVDKTTAELRLVKGIRASDGYASGLATRMGHLDIVNIATLHPDASSHTLADFKRSLADTERQLEELQIQLDERLADVASLIFSAHLLMLKDEQFSGEITRRIAAGSAPTDAIVTVVLQYVQLFEKSQNAMLREKVQDVRDLGHRLLHNLFGEHTDEADYNGQIVIAEALLPSDILKLVAQRAAGLVLIGGGLTSHIAILARSLELPMILVQEQGVRQIPEGTMLLLDADQGNLFVSPAPEVLRNYEGLRKAGQHAADLEKNVRDVTRTADGESVHLMANINLLSDLKIAKRLKAEGVGLYRSEMPFIVRNDFPSEEEQYRIYRKIVEEMDGRPVTFRTLDIGGDKILSYFGTITEANPFLGLRAIRFSLRHRDLFCQQLRALLRAAAGAPTRIMFPLVSSVDDFVEARDVLRECQRRLAADGIEHNASPKVGLMMELPSAVELADDLAAEADFLSIGSNDLIQYILAVDRTNEQIANLFVPYHPAVLRALKRIADAAAAHGTDLSICGEMSADQRLIPFLLGIGIRTFSVDSHQIPVLQRKIGEISLQAARREAETMLKISRIRDVETYLAAGTT